MDTRTLREAFSEMMKSVGTSIPGHVLSFDPGTQLAQLQIGISSTTQDGRKLTPAPIIECPVQFSGGGGWSIEHKIVAGDEGIIIFSQRCVDAWIETGGVAENPISRFHDKQDAYFVPGIRSKPNSISNFANDGVKIRNEDGGVYVWVKDDAGIDMQNGMGNITMLPTGEVNINGVIFSTTGGVTAPESVWSPVMEATTSLIVNSQEMNQHQHDDSGSYNVGGNQVTGTSGVPI